MSPSLEAVMFNRNANLSGRRPLLEGGAPPGVAPFRRAPPEPPARYMPAYWRPPNVDNSRTNKIGFGEAELVFRFEPAPAEFASPPRVPAVQYVRPPRDGPFVFGLHGPSHFPNREPYESPAPDNKSDEVNCCDKVNEWTNREKTKGKKTLNRMFQIKNKSKVNVGKSKEKIKCVLVGDGAVGKTSLITAYAQDTFRDEYQPTAYDTYNVVVDVDGRKVSVEICDTAGQDSMSELRALCYPGTDVLLLCFSRARPETFRSVAGRWARAVKAVGAPVILVATQTDLARDTSLHQHLSMRGERVVTDAEAKSLAAKLGAVYVETSARTRTGLKDAFDAAILAALPITKPKKPFWKKLCCVN